MTLQATVYQVANAFYALESYLEEEKEEADTNTRTS
jgi:hypothetical protein